MRHESPLDYTVEPELNLIAAVFKQAVEDAREGNRHAQIFLRDTGAFDDFRRYFAQQPKQDKRRSGGRKGSDQKKLRDVDISDNIGWHAALQNGGKNSGVQQ